MALCIGILWIICIIMGYKVREEEIAWLVLHVITWFNQLLIIDMVKFMTRYSWNRATWSANDKFIFIVAVVVVGYHFLQQYQSWIVLNGRTTNKVNWKKTHTSVMSLLCVEGREFTSMHVGLTDRLGNILLNKNLKMQSKSLHCATTQGAWHAQAKNSKCGSGEEQKRHC